MHLAHVGSGRLFLCYNNVAESPRSKGAISMKVWTIHDREKSRRGSRPLSIQTKVKVALVAFFLIELAVAAFLLAGGWP